MYRHLSSCLEIKVTPQPTRICSLRVRTPRKQQGWLVSPQNSVGQTIELRLSWSAKTDLGRPPLSGWHKQTHCSVLQDGRRETLLCVWRIPNVPLHWSQISLGFSYFEGAFEGNRATDTQPALCQCLDRFLYIASSDCNRKKDNKRKFLISFAPKREVLDCDKTRTTQFLGS